MLKMKKVVLSLLVAILMVMTPMVTMAEAILKAEIPNDAESTTPNDDGLTTKVYPIYITNEGTADSVSSLEFTFNFGPAIKKHKIIAAEGFTVTPSEDSTTNGTDEKYTFSSTAGVAIDKKLRVGTVVINVDNNSADEDCTIKYSFDGGTGTFNNNNPATGASIPYEIIVGGLVLAAGAYFVTSRKTKMFKI